MTKRPPPTATKILADLRAHSSAAHRATKARLGIPLDSALGVPVPVIRQMGKALGHDQKLAEALWASGYHEARLLAVLVAEPEAMTLKLAERWLGTWCRGICATICATTC